MVLLERILAESWNVLCLSAPYMLFGFFIAGLLKAFIPDDFVARHLGKENGASLLKASLFGVPLPLCSCGVLPAAAGLRKQGASKGATTAFLISTPETGVDSIAVTWALLDPLMAILRPISAFLTAMVTGQLVRTLDPDAIPSPTKPAPMDMFPMAPASETCGCTASVPGKKASLLERLRMGMRFSFGDLFTDISGWFFVGVVIAGFITVFVSPDLVDAYLGNPLVAMLAMLVIGTPLYVCATASTPIAAALVLKGLNPGAALVFLLAGPATNAAALSVITGILGKKSMVLYLIGIMVSSFLLGFAVDAVYSLTGLTAGWQAGAEHAGRTLLGTVSALILFGLVLFGRGGHGSCSDPACECG
ncbi:SO_0444 family Cu/Zn efflux transporter [Desulfoluna sp.]|uniref:SO_0444 family Cu/Zn efflux transporter n=1 Tax=Desulfoluna sp. TaxID=2045199 RepID=UPI00260CE525|nr:SO_0444 family Cu/Zn efflux transporter [Desulfoluna sp.]